MRIVYYTSSINVIGRFVIGLSIGNALVRNGIRCDFTIVHTSPAGDLAGDFNHVKIPLENEIELSRDNYHKSVLYKTLHNLKPDVLLVNHQWFMIHNFIDELKCKKIYLSDQAYDMHFRINLPGGDMIFNTDHYDRVIAIEPFTSNVLMESINPLIIRNKNEIYEREKALNILGLTGSRKNALFCFTTSQENYDELWKKYSYFEKDYDVVRLSMKEFRFPIVDYYNAFDLILCGAGYNNVWSAVYFNKTAIYEPAARTFSDESNRVKTSLHYKFDVNGADQLVDIILGL